MKLNSKVQYLRLIWVNENKLPKFNIWGRKLLININKAPQQGTKWTAHRGQQGRLDFNNFSWFASMSIQFTLIFPRSVSRYVNNTISCPTLTHCPVKSARSPSQCFFSYIGVVTTTMSYGHILRLVPVVPITRSVFTRVHFKLIKFRVIWNQAILPWHPYWTFLFARVDKNL